MNFQPNSYSKSLKQNRARFHLLRRVYPPRRWLTLRLRLAFWTSGMFVILCLGLLVFINLTAGGIRSTQLEGVSLIGFVLTSTLGGLGAYWLAGVALKPVREVSQAAQQISANTLDIRLNSGGPKDELKEDRKSVV